MRTWLIVTALSLAAGSALAQPSTCPVPVFPNPTGLTERPGEKIGQPQTPEDFNSEQDYKWMHSSTNLQGYPTREKFAPCLFYNPTDSDISRQLGNFRSALVINNPSPTATVGVRVILRDRNGAVLTTLPVTLPPNGTWTRGVPELQTLSTGVGTAQIIATAPVVGASIHQADSVIIGGTRITDPDPIPFSHEHPGEAMMQQIQAKQDAGRNLYAGPMPLATSTQFDFLNGNLPFYCAMNTTATPTTVTAFKGSSSGVAIPTLTAALPGFGMFIDMSVWNAAETFYLSNPGPFNDNAWAYVASSASPLVGDLYLADFFSGESPLGQMSLGKKFRVGSAMMANTPSAALTNAEFTQQVGPASPGLDTFMGVLNASTVDIGPINITYRDRDGNIVGAVSEPSLLPGQTLRLTPTTMGSPTLPVFDGWVEIRACRPGMVGWTMREVTRLAGALHFEKAYGEELVGANRAEPGMGVRVIEQGVPVNRKVAPIARVSPTLEWPAYTTFANNSVSNVGNYWYRFFEVLPLSGDVTNYANQPFIGLPLNSTSFTYQDGTNSLVNIGGDQNVSGRVDITDGSVIGITAIGDPMVEWLIDEFPGDPAPGTPPDNDAR